MQTIIQIIETQWTKASRGAPQSERSSKIPQVMRIPEGASHPGALLQHVVHYEHDDFVPRDLVKLAPFTSNDSTKYRIHICETSEGIKIDFSGAPASPTYGHPLTSILIAPNSWVQINANWRLSEESTWSYRKYIYNIYHGARQEVNRVILNEAPSTRFNCEKHLW